MFAATGNLASDPVEAGRTGWLRVAPRRARAVEARRMARTIPSPDNASSALSRIMIVLGALVSAGCAPVPDDRQHLASRGPRLDRGRGRRRRGARHHHPERRPLGRGDHGPGRLPVALPSSSRRSTRRAILFGLRRRARPGDDQRVLVTGLRVPAIVATLGTLSIFRGFDSSSRAVTRYRSPACRRASRSRHATTSSDPGLRRGRAHRRRHRHGGAALDALRSTGLRRRQQPGGGLHPRHPVAAGHLAAFARAACSRAWRASCGSSSSGPSTAPRPTA